MKAFYVTLPRVGAFVKRVLEEAFYSKTNESSHLG
jgi:hypothetical protein